MTRGRYTYTAFGLSVRSEIRIHEFVECDLPRDVPADVTIRCGTVDHPGANVDGWRDIHCRHRDELYLGLEIGDVLIRNGSEIVVDSAPDADRELVRWYLVGSVFNHLLYQRGFLLLHASIVQIGDVAAGFLGESTAGKSTTALAHLHAGHHVVADDVAAITFDDEAVLVQPGFPALKLDGPTLSTLPTPLEALPEQSPTLDRHFYRVPGDPAAAPLPLVALYLLTDGTQTSVRPLAAPEALMGLIENTYTDLRLEGTASVTDNLAHCARVVRSVPVKTLQRKRVRSELPTIVDTVLDDIQAVTC